MATAATTNLDVPTYGFVPLDTGPGSVWAGFAPYLCVDPTCYLRPFRVWARNRKDAARSALRFAGIKGHVRVIKEGGAA